MQQKNTNWEIIRLVPQNFKSIVATRLVATEVEDETPKCDKHLISPHNITPKSNIKAKRIKEIIQNSSSSQFVAKCSLA